MKVQIRTVTPREASSLVKELGELPADRQDIVRRHLRNTFPIYAGYVEEELAVVLGLIPPTILSDQAYLWLYHTDVINEHLFLFVRYSQRLVEEMLKIYPKIVGYTDMNETKSIRWLKWLGAEYGEPEDHGFVPFVIRRK